MDRNDWDDICRENQFCWRPHTPTFDQSKLFSILQEEAHWERQGTKLINTNPIHILNLHHKLWTYCQYCITNILSSKCPIVSIHHIRVQYLSSLHMTFVLGTAKAIKAWLILSTWLWLNINASLMQSGAVYIARHYIISIRCRCTLSRYSSTFRLLINFADWIRVAQMISLTFILIIFPFDYVFFLRIVLTCNDRSMKKNSLLQKWTFYCF